MTDQVSRQAVLDVLEAATQRHSEKGDRAAVEEDSAKLSAAVYVVNVLLDAQAAVSALPSATTAGEGVLAEIPEDPWRARSEERRVGKECVSTCRSRWSPYH